MSNSILTQVEVLGEYPDDDGTDNYECSAEFKAYYSPRTELIFIDMIYHGQSAIIPPMPQHICCRSRDAVTICKLTISKFLADFKILNPHIINK